MAEAEAAESLRDTLDAVIDEVAVEPTPEQPPVEEPAPNEPAPAEAPAEETPPEPAEAAPAEEPVDDIPVLGEKTVDRPPASWKGDAKKVWAELPEAARNEVVRRERQVDQVLKESADARAIANSVTDMASRYQDVISRYGRPPAQIFENFLSAERILTSAPPADRAKFMAKLIQDYRIDIAALDSALSGQPIQQSAHQDVNEQVKQLLAQELAPFKQRMQMEQEAQQQEVAHTIESMAQDHEKFPYFEDVRDDMADLIEIRARRGVYLSLEQAYSIATGGNPDVAAAQASTQQRTQAIKAHEVAQKAKTAAVSVAGSPATTSGGPDPSNLRANIESAIDGARL